MSDPYLESLLSRPVAEPEPEATAAVAAGPIDPAQALGRDELDRLCDPAPLPAETGWCTLADGVGYVAARTTMPGVTGEMVDWWFDWHPREPIRYRVWHPLAHVSNSLDPPSVPDARPSKPFWGATHHPVEDVGVGVAHARISFLPPSAIGFSTDALDDPRVATIVGGHVGDDRRRSRHSLMVHVFLAEDGGVVLRSRFWFGALMRPYLPGPLAAAAEPVLNTRFARRRLLPPNLPRAVARHCIEEYANLAELLPDLHQRYGSDPIR
jgi:hypothetical protein